MALDRYERKDSIERGSVVPATGLRAVANSWADVGRTAGKLRDQFADEKAELEKIRGKEEGERAVWVDPETNIPQIVGTLPEGTSPHALEYRKAAEARYQAELGLSSMTKVAQLSNENYGNPEGFRNAWAGYTKGIVDNVPGAIRPGTDLLLKQVGTEQYAKMQMDVEVVSANYSHTYNIFWVTAITADNQAVFFSYRSKLDTGTWIHIKGTVKAHRDGKTQLNRVKVI